MGRFHNNFPPEHEEELAAHVNGDTNKLMPLNRTKFLSHSPAGQKGEIMIFGKNNLFFVS